MKNSEIIEKENTPLQIFFTEFSDENDHYDETEDDYDINEEDIYDDGIANSSQDDGYDEAFDEDSDETIPEAAHPENTHSPFKEELEDSLQESEDYDELDD